MATAIGPRRHSLGLFDAWKRRRVNVRLANANLRSNLVDNTGGVGYLSRRNERVGSLQLQANDTVD
jgi:hypothetical protein